MTKQLMKIVGIAGIVILILNFIFFIFGWINWMAFWFIIIAFAIIAWLMKRKRVQ